MSFAALETRLNAAANKRLANATAYLLGGESFAVIFDNTYLAALGGQVTAAQPQASALQSDLDRLDVSVGTALNIRETDYTVRDLQPDGTGWVDVVLEAA